MTLRVFLVAGEPSGDRLGAALMAGLKALAGDVTFAGVGGTAMAAEGLDSLFPMEELSVMGLAEVLPRYRQLRRRISQTARAVIETRPDVLVTIDSPDFSLRVDRLVRAASAVRIVHYVAPSVWAWRAGRARRMAAHVDQVLALLPFEPPYMEAAGMRCDFVGHPVVAEPQPDAAAISAFRAEVVPGPGPVVLVLPGSRKSEVTRLAPVFGEAIRRLAEQNKGLQLVLPAAPGVVDEVRAAVADWPVAPSILDPTGLPATTVAARKRLAFAAADAALAASGTVSLELAAAETPAVIAYDMNWLSWQIISRMVRVDSATLTNLISGSRAVPEFLGPACKPGPIAEALHRVLHDDGERQRQRAAMTATMQALGRGGEAPGLRAARAVLDGLGRPVKPARAN